MSKERDFEKEGKNIRKTLIDQANRAISVRSKDREFHGLEREFLYFQAQMIIDYEKSKDIKHPRDVGTVREWILRDFLQKSGLTPKKYGISELSVRIASTSGHISNEIDIAFYNPNDSIRLMKRSEVYEVYPVENIYGVIQVKSNLTKKEFRSGLKNLLSFKKLIREPFDHSLRDLLTSKNDSKKGFSVLFSYTSDMKWKDIISELKFFSTEHPRAVLPNAIFILDRGFFFFGNGSKPAFTNDDINSLEEITIHGWPDRQNLCLYNFQTIILDLLRTTTTNEIRLEKYFRLPFVALEQSYSFLLGAFAEVANCEKHGDYQRKISKESLDTIIKWCEESKPESIMKATNIAYGLSSDNEVNERNSQMGYIYNPENLHYADILLMDSNSTIQGINIQSLAVDMIQTNGLLIWIPYYYSIKKQLISECPKCKKINEKNLDK